MKGFPVSLSGALLIAGCSSAGEEQAVENAVRAQLATSGTVLQVDMTKRGDNDYSGFATVRTADGNVARLNCTMHRSGSRIEGVCGQVIDQALIDQTKAAIRQLLTSQGATVSRVEMSRQDDDHMTGYAEARDTSGNEGRINCVSPRDAASGRFSLRCEPAAAAAPPAQPPAGPDDPAEEEQPPADDGGQ